MLYILYGKDDFSLNETLKELKKSIGDETLLSANTTTLDGEHLSPDELMGITQTVPFLTEKRLVIVHGLLGRFQPKERPARRKTSPPSKSEEDGYRAFTDIIKNIPQSTVLVLVDSEVRRDNPLYALLQSSARINSYAPLRSARLIQWIEKRVKDAQGSITPEARDTLARLVGGNLWIMSNELEKLMLFASGRQIEESDVLLLVADAREASVFALVDAFFEGNAQAAAGLLGKLIDAGEAPSFLLFMLERELQLIVRIKDLKRQGKSRSEIQQRLGIPDFACQKASEQADRYSLSRVREMYEKLLETDIAIKTGRYDEELAISILIHELSSKV